MDKFGFFNLLNSFFPKNAQSEQKNDADSGLSPDFLGDLFSNFSKQNPNDIANPPPSQQKQTNSIAPLQNNMLSTMANHDDFVKRVKQKHKI